MCKREGGMYVGYGVCIGVGVGEGAVKLNISGILRTTLDRGVAAARGAG